MGRVLVAEGSAASRIAAFLFQQGGRERVKAGLLPVEPDPPVADDDLDLLDPWVIDGRYAADSPAPGGTEASELLDAAAASATCVHVRLSKRLTQPPGTRWTEHRRLDAPAR